MKKESLIETLNFNDKGVISLMGAGGKTTLMFQLARALQRAGKKVLTTTTTKIFMPPPSQSETVILSADGDDLLWQLKTKLQQTDHITAGECLIQEMDKISGFSGETVDQLWQSGLFDWIIVEADGAAGKSLKACNATEPVLPSCTGHLVLVAGLDALGRSLCDDHVHRSLLFSQNSGLPLGHTVDIFHMARGLAVEMEKIYFLQPDVFKYVVLNKADTAELESKGRAIVELLKPRGTCHGVMVAAFEAKSPVKKWYDMR